eukprot:1156674-Pelagomonas_calceolata.AAC.4
MAIGCTIWGKDGHRVHHMGQRWPSGASYGAKMAIGCTIWGKDGHRVHQLIIIAPLAATHMGRCTQRNQEQATWGKSAYWHTHHAQHLQYILIFDVACGTVKPKRTHAHTQMHMDTWTQPMNTSSLLGLHFKPSFHKQDTRSWQHFQRLCSRYSLS